MTELDAEKQENMSWNQQRASLMMMPDMMTCTVKMKILTKLVRTSDKLAEAVAGSLEVIAKV